jgi:hypothetical protein
MNTRIVTRTRAWLIAMTAVFTATTVSGPASAAGFGGALQPGSIVCTDWLRTDGGGIYLNGYATGTGTYTWTMLMTTSPGGQEVELLRFVGTGLNRQVVAPLAGTFFYRNCLKVSNRQASGYRLTISAGVRSVNPVYGVGPHTAQLTPGSMACGEFAMAPTVLRGNSDRSVQWSARGTDLDYASVGRVFMMTGATVDQVLDPGMSLFSLDACAANTGSTPASVSFDFLEP